MTMGRDTHSLCPQEVLIFGTYVIFFTFTRQGIKLFLVGLKLLFNEIGYLEVDYL